MGCRQRSMRWCGSAAALAAACIGLVSCGGGGDDPAEREESASTSAAPEPTSTTLSPTQEVEAAFLAFDAMVERLAQAPNPDDPEIAQRASGEILAGVQQSQTTLRTTGYRAEFGERQATHILEVSIVDAATATLLDCSIDDRTEITPTGAKGPFLETYWTEWTLRQVEGVWYVDSGDAVDMQQGEQSCE